MVKLKIPKEYKGKVSSVERGNVKISNFSIGKIIMIKIF